VARTVALPGSAQNERRIADAFRTRGAMTGASALPLMDLGLMDSRPLRRMVAEALVRRAGPHRYYLDEQVWASRRGLAWRNVLRAVVGVTLAIAATALFLYNR
jgi:hypothetical protein